MNTILPSAKEADLAVRTNVFVLLVGINAYVNYPLDGPLNDVQNVNDFLKSHADINLNSVQLIDEQASKKAVVAAFRQHLGQAKSGDTALFYFSGHGTREQADPTIWVDEPTGVLPSIACYNGGALNSWDFLLTNKELRYLLHEVTQNGSVHTAAIFDCCHSGGNTRSLLDLGTQPTRQRSILDIFPLRPWSAFLFSDQISEEQARHQPIQEWLPEPVHIQIAACEADEKALEMDNNGVFTKNLLTVLQANGGAVSYESLVDRTRQYMRFGYDQRPRLFTPNGVEALKRTTFLNRSVQADSLAVQAQFSRSRDGRQDGWYINVGTLHGLQPGQEVHLLTATGQALIDATVLQVWIDYASLSFAPDVQERLDPALVYSVRVPSLMSKPLRIYFASRNGAPAEQAKLLTELMAEVGSYYIPEENESAADYAIYVRNGWYFLTLPNLETQPDNEFRPLAEPVLITDKNATQTLGTYIQQLSHWSYIRTLKNPAATGVGVKLEVVPEANSPLVVQGDATVPVPLLERDGMYLNNVVIRVTNTTNEPLYCTVVYLPHGIGSMVQFLDSNTLLAPNQTVVVGQNARQGADNSTRVSLPLSSAGEDVVHDYNWPTVDEWLQLIFTTKSANASGQLSETTLNFLQFDELPKPPTLADRNSTQDRAIAAWRTPISTPLPTWWTQSLNLRWANPSYNKISRDDLNAMIEPRPNVPADDALADCALGLYFTINTDNPLEPKLQIKPELQEYWASQQEGQRGLGEDISLAIASRVSQAIRNRQFQTNRVAYPTRPRIVANGDSWFQYPFLIRDIIDCLTNGYSVYSLASTDKTLKAMQSGEDVLKAIDIADAQFLLFSGGLNDLIRQLPDTFVRDQADQSLTTPVQYLTDAFFQSLDLMQNQYEQLFETVESQKPQVTIIVHGYDYIRSVNAVSEDRNWLAPELAKKGITDLQAQQDLLNTMIDEFNSRLKKAADRFENVYYLDLRHTIAKPTYWHDEIHPNDAGFLDLAYQFAKQIRAIQQPASTSVN